MWQLRCVNIHCPHLASVVSYKQKECETSPGRQSAGGSGWLKSSIRLDGFDSGGSLVYTDFTPLASATTAVLLRLGHVLSHGVAVFGGLVGGGGL